MFHPRIFWYYTIIRECSEYRAAVLKCLLSTDCWILYTGDYVHKRYQKISLLTFDSKCLKYSKFQAVRNHFPYRCQLSAKKENLADATTACICNDRLLFVRRLLLCSSLIWWEHIVNPTIRAIIYTEVSQWRYSQLCRQKITCVQSISLSYIDI